MLLPKFNFKIFVQYQNYNFKEEEQLTEAITTK